MTALAYALAVTQSSSPLVPSLVVFWFLMMLDNGYSLRREFAFHGLGGLAEFLKRDFRSVTAKSMFAIMKYINATGRLNTTNK